MSSVFFTHQAVNPDFNSGEINDVIKAIEAEMTSHSNKRHDGRDFLVYGGEDMTDAGEFQIGQHSLAKNWNVIHVALDAAKPKESVDRGLCAIRCFLTDGATASYVLRGGRLWKRDARTPAMLVFPEHDAVMKISAKGRSIVRRANGKLHEFGYRLATQAVRKRITHGLNNVAVITTIGQELIVHDIETSLKLLSGG